MKKNKNAQKLIMMFLILLVLPTMVSAGLGAKFGFSKDTQSDTFNKGMTMIGADYRFSAMPMVDLIGTVEYSWKKYEAGGGIPVSVTRHFFTANASVVKPFNMSLLKPYAGFGYGFHVLGGSVEALGFTGGGAITGSGFHIIGGLKVSPPAAPISVYGEYRHYWTKFSGVSMRYFSLAAGVMLGF